MIYFLAASPSPATTHPHPFCHPGIEYLGILIATRTALLQPLQLLANVVGHCLLNSSPLHVPRCVAEPGVLLLLLLSHLVLGPSRSLTPTPSLTVSEDYLHVQDGAAEDGRRHGHREAQWDFT